YLRHLGGWLLSDRGVPKADFAPNWAAHEAATKRKPLSIDLTRRRHDWHAQQWDDTIYSQDEQGQFFARKKLDKVDPDHLPEDSKWASRLVKEGKTELIHPSNGQKV